MHIVLAANDADQPWVTTATAAFARQSGASVAVLSVDELELERLAAAPRSVFVEQAERAATAAVQRLAEAGVPATRTVLAGPAVDRILEFAEREQADVIVVAASARPQVAVRLLGSVPLALVDRSPLPVLVVTNPERNARG